MPTVSRSRLIAAPLESVWRLVRDPHNLPRWWPRVARVEDVRGEGNELRWTAVLRGESGSYVRADYRLTELRPQAALAWAQELAGSPFERILASSALAIELSAAGEGTEVRLTAAERLRGISRLGAPLLRGAAGRRLEEALDGIELAVGGASA